jgi:hypothetical protein
MSIDTLIAIVGLAVAIVSLLVAIAQLWLAWKEQKAEQQIGKEANDVVIGTQMLIMLLLVIGGTALVTYAGFSVYNLVFIGNIEPGLLLVMTYLVGVLAILLIGALLFWIWLQHFYGAYNPDYGVRPVWNLWSALGMSTFEVIGVLIILFSIYLIFL